MGIFAITLILLPFMLLLTDAHFQRQKSLKLQSETNVLLLALIAKLGPVRQAPESPLAPEEFSS